jgi:UDP-N-acetylmuramyl pentapeptide synthase
LEVLEDFSGRPKIVVLGDMAELGSQTESGHREVGAKIYESGIDAVYLVGPKTKFIEDELVSRKFTGRINWFKDSDAAKTFVRESLDPQSTILIKGSQAARMEKVVKAIMLKPELAPKLLVRQSKQWE